MRFARSAQHFSFSVRFRGSRALHGEIFAFFLTKRAKPRTSIANNPAHAHPLPGQLQLDHPAEQPFRHRLRPVRGTQPFK